MKYKNKAVKYNAFTLTEVLLAVAVVGILAALVIPPTVTKFNTKVLEIGFQRQSQTIKSAVDSLPIKENVKNFSETSMYSNGTLTADATSGKFMKRYLRVSKYYGDAAANKALIKKECFADKYYEYSEKSKKEYSIDSDLVGACAKLKNGSSICLAPQVGGVTNIQGIMDINGPKAPNILGKDLRRISLGTVAFSNRSSQVTSDAVSTDVYTQDDPDISGAGYEGLCEGDFSEACCAYHNEKGSITGPTHGCCANPSVASTITACSNEVTIILDYYPTSNCTIGQWNSGSCSPRTEHDDTKALNSNGLKMVALPATPPDVIVYCDGVKAGYLSGSALKSAILSDSGNTYFTKSITNVGDNSRSCVYGGQTEGIVNGAASVVFPNGSSLLTQNGVNWRVKKH